MQIADSFVVRAAAEKVWEFLFDVQRVSQCVPGVEIDESLDGKTYRGRFQVRVGPVAAAFSGTATIVEAEAPRRLVAAIEGDDKTSASTVKAEFSARLNPVEDGTQVAYEMDLNLRGRLAQFGGPVIAATARKITAEFARNMEAGLED